MTSPIEKVDEFEAWVREPRGRITVSVLALPLLVGFTYLLPPRMVKVPPFVILLPPCCLLALFFGFVLAATLLSGKRHGGQMVMATFAAVGIAYGGLLYIVELGFRLGLRGNWLIYPAFGYAGLVGILTPIAAWWSWFGKRATR